MAEDGAVTIYNGSITTIDPKKIAESTGSSCIIISDPFELGRISCTSDPSLIKEIKNTVSTPIKAKSQVGHFVESQIVNSVGVEYIDESEVLSIADEENFINKHNFRRFAVVTAAGTSYNWMQVMVYPPAPTSGSMGSDTGAIF